MKIPELRTDRLLLRGWREEDLDAWAAVAADAEAMRWVGSPEGMGRAQAWRHMAYLVGHWALRGHGLWAVEAIAGGGLLGRVGLLRPEGWPGLEVGWLIAARTGDAATLPRPLAPPCAGPAKSWAPSTSSA